MPRGQKLTQQSQQGRDNEDIQEEILQEIRYLKGKFTQLSTTVSAIQASVRELELKQDRTNHEENLTNVETTVKATQEACTRLENLIEAQDDTRHHAATEVNLNTEVDKIKEAIKQTWNQRLIKRRFAFWNFIKNKNKAEVYTSWINSNPIVVPRKFQMKQILNENEAHRKIRERLALESFNGEVELLTLRALPNEDKLKKIDQEMKEEIKGKGTRDTQRELI